MKTNPAKRSVKRLIFALLASAVSVTGISRSQTINVNFERFTPSPITPEVESTLEGPGGGLGTSWNQYAAPDSSGTVVDSTGAATTIAIDTNFTEGRYDGTGAPLTMLRTTLTDFSRGLDNKNVTITGLAAGSLYDVWLVSLRSQSPDAERVVGWWSTGNATTSASDQSIDTRGGALNNSTFVAGYNYVLFENVEADGSGQIVFSGVAGTLLDGSDNAYRHGLNGLQLQPAGLPPGPVDAGASTVVASPTAVAADGSSTSTITVTLRDASGKVVAGKDVTLANTAGPQAADILPVGAVTTDAIGEAIFTVSSSTVGVEEFTATDVTDSNLVITQTASVEFEALAGPVDAGVSTVAASPSAVLADGSSTSTITVTLKDAAGNAVEGKDVTLANTAGPQAAVINPLTAQTTDVNGEATFTVSSSTVGVEEFTATDVTDGNLVITQTASVNFVSGNDPLVLNVNFNGFTGNPDAGQVESSLEGPAGGLGTSWNQFADEDSTGTLVDSNGLATTVGFTTNFTEGRYNGTGPPLTMLRAALTDFGRGATRNLTITGLEADGYYDIWLVGYRDSGAVAERLVGNWATTNGTTSSPDQLIDNRVGNNGATFVEGYNYVLFEYVQADGTGQIVFDGKGATVADGFDADYRHGLNGFQIQETEAPLALITSFGIPGSDGVIDQNAKTISLEVPAGTDLATLAPEFTLISGTCDQTSGSPPSPTFAASNPVDYVVTDTSSDPDTVNTYSVTVTVAPAVGTIVIDLGTSPAGTEIEGGTFGSHGTNLPLPALPVGSILRSIAVDTLLEATDNENFASDLAVLLDPTPGTPGGDFSVEITNGVSPFGGALALPWPSGADAGVGTALVDTKTDADFGSIDLGTTGLFLGNAYVDAGFTPGDGGTWSGTITLTYDIVGGGSDYDTWASGFAPADLSNPAADFDGDGLTNDEERLFGLDPTDPSSVNPITLPLDPGANTFSYTRRNPSLSGAVYSVWTSTNLMTWTEDLGASQDDGGAVTDIQTVAVTLTATPVDGKLFVQVRAN